MARINTTKWKVLESVRAHVQAELALNERTAVHLLEPTAVYLPLGGTFWIAVCPGPGQIDDGLFEGGGRAQVTDWFQVAVAGYSRVHLDQTGHDAYLLGEPARGVVQIHERILDALTGEDLTIGGQTYGRQLWQPTSYYYSVVHARGGDGKLDESLPIGMVVQHFQNGFDWDLG